MYFARKSAAAAFKLGTQDFEKLGFWGFFSRFILFYFSLYQVAVAFRRVASAICFFVCCVSIMTLRKSQVQGHWYYIFFSLFS